MKESLPADEVLTLWTLLGQTRDIIRRSIRKELEPFNVTYRQTAVLMVVKYSDGAITPAEISRQLFREPHTISAILNRMEQQGLLKMTRDLEKKNRIRVTLTEAGEEKYLQTCERKSIYRIFSCLSAEEAQQMTKYLKKVRRRGMKEIGIKKDTLFSPGAL